jgi:hypothetical protein
MKVVLWVVGMAGKLEASLAVSKAVRMAVSMVDLKAGEMAEQKAAMRVVWWVDQMAVRTVFGLVGKWGFEWVVCWVEQWAVLKAGRWVVSRAESMVEMKGNLLAALLVVCWAAW